MKQYRERSNFPRIWFRDLRIRFWGLEIKHLKAHNFLWQGCFFLPLLSRNFDDQLSSNFHRFVILCICWDTASEKAGLPVSLPLLYWPEFLLLDGMFLALSLVLVGLSLAFNCLEVLGLATLAEFSLDGPALDDPALDDPALDGPTLDGPARVGISVSSSSSLWDDTALLLEDEA